MPYTESNHFYLADGTKVSALDSEGDGLVYLGSLIYRKTGNAIELEVTWTFGVIN